MALKFETNLPLKDTFHELNKIMEKVDYQGNRYIFKSPEISGSLLQGNILAGLEFRLSEVMINEPVYFVRRKAEAPRWYMDMLVRPEENGQGYVTRVTFHNRKDEGEVEMSPAALNSCNFQISPSVLQPFYLGKYEQLQEVMEKGDRVNIQLPALPGSAEVIRRCLDQTIDSVLHSRILHNHVEGLFLSHLSLCWDELLESTSQS